MCEFFWTSKRLDDLDIVESNLHTKLVALQGRLKESNTSAQDELNKFLNLIEQNSKNKNFNKESMVKEILDLLEKSLDNNNKGTAKKLLDKSSKFSE